MSIQSDAAGIIIDFLVKRYKKSTKENWDEQWCRCDFTFRSGEWLNYHVSDDEVLLSCEVEELEENLSLLLEGKLTDKKTILPIEPDFQFYLYPEEDLRNNPNYVYIQPGCEIQDIYLEWKVYFWYEGLTDNHLIVTLGRDEITALRDYLRTIIGK